MCKALILLGQNHHRQMIFTCDHGTIHITHQQTTLCMTRYEFLHFAEVLLFKGLHILNQSRHWRVREGEGERMELWINNGGIRLEAVEFFALTDLIRKVTNQLNDPNLSVPQPNHDGAPGTKQRWSLN